MSYTELLIEGLEYSIEEWLEELSDGLEEAIHIVNKALKELPNEDEMAIVFSYTNNEYNEFESTNMIKEYKKILKNLKKDLENRKN